MPTLCTATLWLISRQSGNLSSLVPGQIYTRHLDQASPSLLKVDRFRKAVCTCQCACQCGPMKCQQDLNWLITFYQQLSKNTVNTKCVYKRYILYIYYIPYQSSKCNSITVLISTIRPTVPYLHNIMVPYLSAPIMCYHLITPVECYFRLQQ